LSLGEGRQKLRVLVAGRFDFADMARSALGYHWRELSKEQPQQFRYAQVNAKVVQQGRDAIPLDFRLRQEGNDWKIYDVTVDGISITANHRNQFGRVNQQRGFGQLMSDLHGKQQELLDAYLTRGNRSFPVMGRELTGAVGSVLAAMSEFALSMLLWWRILVANTSWRVRSCSDSLLPGIPGLLLRLGLPSRKYVCRSNY
jgi:hypothetical protein